MTTLESWPLLRPEFEVTQEDILANMAAARAVLEAAQVDALIVTSADPHLNEYTPRHDNHRYCLSGFTGSTALALLPREASAPLRLYVDGRYHLQADQECDVPEIEVVKVPFGVTISQALIGDAGVYSRVAFEGDRVSCAFQEALNKFPGELKLFNRQEIGEVLNKEIRPHAKEIEFVSEEISGRSTRDKLTAVFEAFEDPAETLLLLTALDDIAWISDGRGYHFRYQSSFAALGFATAEGVVLVVDAPLLTPELEAATPAGITWTSDSLEQVMARAEFASKKRVSYDPRSTTVARVELAKEQCPSWEFVAEESPIVALRAVKTPAEIDHMVACNERSCRAIHDTITAVQSHMAAEEALSEFDFLALTNKNYLEVGARDLSFGTIAAVAENSAFIHYSDSKVKKMIAASDCLLLDSGALYEGGFATDITRTFFASDYASGVAASARQKEIYTLVLKGLMQAMSAKFPENTPGHFLDALARAPIFEAGLNFAHGTGHGVGIHVHEPGMGISPSSKIPLRKHGVTSIEPGIYLEGFGGVRLENVVVMEEVAGQSGFLQSRCLNYIGYDPALVELSMLGEKERQQIMNYERECERRGCGFGLLKVLEDA